MFDKNEYDRSVNTFSSQGRLFQVEYAMKAVENGQITLGMQLSNGVILAAEKKIENRLQIPKSIEKISKINDNIIATYSGLLSDSRSLLDHARVEAANHWFVYNEEMPIESLALSVCEFALSLADKTKKNNNNENTKNISRPFGCSLLLGGIDKLGKPVLFRNDPSGNYSRFRACCIGAGGENGMITLSEHYKEDVSLDEALKLAIRVVKENMEQKINKENVEISHITYDKETGTSKVVNLNVEQIESLIKSL